ncbi:DUF4328 domain-containing protein [Propionibacterium freudenreichii]|uniref:DUF4328 domain-containing protein n=1 Tax=Propionibacterium freudenreichii TaxID=1744 RepID=UPI00054423D1|nr:DUF4328 domain-containing protein [Propionibacterium freudenreichii]CEH00492.1 Hypothetical membrane protein [Propionibacterium freudenreichii]
MSIPTPPQGWRSQARLLTMLLWLNMAVQLLAGAMCLLLATRVDTPTDSVDDPGLRMFDAWQLLTTATGLVFMLTAIVWLVWQRGTARMALRWAPELSQPAWQLFNWVIPLINLWRPLVDLRALHRVFTIVRKDEMAADGIRGSIELAQVRLDDFRAVTTRWWACWITFATAQLVAAWIVAGASGTTGARAGFIASGIADLLALPAAFLATRVVSELTRRVADAAGLRA